MKKGFLFGVALCIEAAISVVFFQCKNAGADTRSGGELKFSIDTKSYHYADSVGKAMIKERPQSVKWIKVENLMQINYVPPPYSLAEATVLADSFVAMGYPSRLCTGMLAVPTKYVSTDGNHSGEITIWWDNKEKKYRRDYVKDKYSNGYKDSYQRCYIVVVNPESPL